MDQNTIVQLGAVMVAGILGYFLREAHQQVKEAKKEISLIQKDFSDLSLHMATHYARKDEMEKLETALEKLSDQMLMRIEQLGNKIELRFDQFNARLDTQLKDVYNQINGRDSHG